MKEKWLLIIPFKKEAKQMNSAETYQYVESTDGKSTFYYTDCGNRMFYIDKDPMKYHGCLCPKCFMEGKQVTLYLRGTPEANKIWDERLQRNK